MLTQIILGLCIVSLISSAYGLGMIAKKYRVIKKQEDIQITQMQLINHKNISKLMLLKPKEMKYMAMKICLFLFIVAIIANLCTICLFTDFLRAEKKRKQR